jgi:predicted acetyltransferase
MTSSDRPDPAPWTVRSLTDADWPAFINVDQNAFGATTPADYLELERGLQDMSRALGAFDGDAGGVLAGITTSYEFDLSVPGGSVPAAGVTWVGVLPTYRRRRVLSTLMQAQLDAVHDAATEPIAVLWASEPQIYGRFGYGMASRYYSRVVPRGADALLPDVPSDPSLRMRLVPAGDWALTAPVYDGVRANRPGMTARDEAWWKRAVLDIESFREGKSELRCVVAEDEGGVRGYARYSTKQSFGDDFGRGKIDVRELLAADPAALAALYRYLFDMDLMGTTHLWNLPTDDPLQFWLANPRQTSPRSVDQLYVRVVDLPAALTARRYATDVSLVLDVVDERCPWNAGRWRLEGGRDGASCSRTDDDAQLTLDARELGAVYLGGTTFLELAGAGRVTGAAEVVSSATAAFQHSPAPWCPQVF